MTKTILSRKIISLLGREKCAFHGRASVARWGWSNSSRNFNSEVQNIPEEYFDLGNFKLKHQNMPVQDMLEKEKVDKLVEYSTKFPKAVNAADLLENQESGEYSEEKSFQFLKEEVAVRLAHLVMELQHLPKELRLERQMLLLMQKYSLSFTQIIEFEKKEADRQTLQDFRTLLVDLKERHKRTHFHMAESCNSMKENLSISSDDINNHIFSAVKIFLDRLYTNRIGIHMITDQHLHLFGGSELCAPQRTGVIVPNTNLLESLRYAIDEATVHTENVYMAAPRVKYHVCVTSSTQPDKSEPTGHFIPLQLFNIFYELLMNSMRAVVEFHWESGSFPPIDVLVIQSNEDFSVKISDQGGGMDRETSAKVFHYQFSKASKFTNSHVMGYGLPLARLYARYFGGDLRVTSYDGYGTDMHVYLTNLDGAAKERLPIYTKESVELWSKPDEENNWSSNIWSKMEWWGDKVGPRYQYDEIAVMRRLDVRFLRPDVEEQTIKKA